MFRLMNKLTLVVFFFVMIYPLSGDVDDSNSRSGISLYETGKYREAAAELKNHIDSHPTDVEALRYLTLCYINLEEDKDAVKIVEKLVANDEDNAEYQYTAALAYGLRAQQAGLLKKAGYAKKMKAAVERAIQLNPDHIAARQVLMQFHLFAPGIMGGDKAEAYQQAQAIMERNRMRGHHVLAMCYMKDQCHEDAENEYRISISEMPDSIQHYFWYQNWLSGQDRHNDATMILRDMLAIDSTIVDAWIQMGHLTIIQEKYDDSIVAFKTALNYEPDNVTALYQIGKVAAISSEYGEDGLCALDKLYRIDDLNTTYRTWSQVRRGQILEQSKRVDEARQAFQLALSINKDNKVAKKALKRLSGN
ncbi:tetratricopeptide repeat protein [bacterium]|nr:tetratricopeptide repeat protein [bacterium]